MKTIKEFCANSNIPESLIRAVVRQSGGWDCFKESAPDIRDHGAAGGFRGFIYYTETTAFSKKHLIPILQLCRDMAADFGTTVPALIAGFNCLQGYDENDVAMVIGRAADEDTTTQVLNALCWFALEGVSRAYMDLVEGE